jgi:hypothetical protein
MKKIFFTLGFAVALSWYSNSRAAAAPTPFTVNFEGVQFSVVEQSPHLNSTPLQVFGVFEYKKGEDFSGADVEMDELLHGVIQEIRKSFEHGFQARLGETLLLQPSDSKIVPKRVLVMGLGDSSKFKAEEMNQVGATGVREACRLGLTEFAHASDVQDGGVHTPAGPVAENVLNGMIQALRLQRFLAEKGMIEACPLKKITLLAGPKFFKETTETLGRVTRN